MFLPSDDSISASWAWFTYFIATSTAAYDQAFLSVFSDNTELTTSSAWAFWFWWAASAFTLNSASVEVFHSIAIVTFSWTFYILAFFTCAFDATSVLIVFLLVSMVANTWASGLLALSAITSDSALVFVFLDLSILATFWTWSRATWFTEALVEATLLVHLLNSPWAETWIWTSNTFAWFALAFH